MSDKNTLLIIGFAGVLIVCAGTLLLLARRNSERNKDLQRAINWQDARDGRRPRYYDRYTKDLACGNGLAPAPCLWIDYPLILGRTASGKPVAPTTPLEDNF